MPQESGSSLHIGLVYAECRYVECHYAECRGATSRCSTKFMPVADLGVKSSRDKYTTLLGMFVNFGCKCF